MLRVNLPLLKESLPKSCCNCKHTIEPFGSLILCQYTKKVVEDEKYEKARREDCPLEMVGIDTV